MSKLAPARSAPIKVPADINAPTEKYSDLLTEFKCVFDNYHSYLGMMCPIDRRSLAIGWALAKGLLPKHANEFAALIR